MIAHRGHTIGEAPFTVAKAWARDVNGARGAHVRAFEHYCLIKEPSVIVWLPPASIANTSNGCSPPARDWTNSGVTVTHIDKLGGTVTTVHRTSAGTVT
jgi:hypothetical protein